MKKAESFIVSDPITLTVNNTVGDARRLVDETGTGGILILTAGRNWWGL